MGLTRLLETTGRLPRLQRGAISRQNEDEREEGRALAGLGAVALISGRGEEAIPQLTTTLSFAERAGDRWLAGMSLSLLGRAHQLHGRTEAALDCFGLAYTYAETSGRPSLLSRALYCIGDVHLSLGRHREARGMFRRALDLVTQSADQSADTAEQALLLARLGTAQEGIGDLDNALSLHHEALAAHELLDPLKEPQYNRLEMDIRCRLGQTYATAGRLGEAREQFRAALTVPGAEAHTFEYARAEAGLAACQPT
ncbi:tetratricopeptide repeat protein [Streptomyces sp. NPDC001933]|uniref:tetratricopeptide repeat protein n=1 Tax=Streptomyces sp. NPDC001933 TaxID=3364626 RepID=UPI0036C4FA35